MKIVTKQDKIILSLFTTIILILIVVGFTYSYYLLVINRDNNVSMSIQSANLEIVYAEGNVFNAMNIAPGTSNSKTFSVTNDSGTSITYSIDWTSIENELINKNDLVYTLSGLGTGACTKSETIVPSVSGEIVTNCTIADGQTHNYTLTITYKNTASVQNSDMEKTFSLKYEIYTQSL